MIVPEDPGKPEKRLVTCVKCNRVWWLTYTEAMEGMQKGDLTVKHRPKRGV